MTPSVTPAVPSRGAARRVAGIAIVAAAVLAAAPARAAPAEICVLYPSNLPAYDVRVRPAFEAGLRDQRLEPGRDVIVTPYGAGFDWTRLPQLTADCLARKPGAIAAISPPAVFAARDATRTVPLVVQDLETDPVAAGLVESLARPGGNLSGFFFDFPAFGAKWLELVGETLPGLTRIGVLWDPATSTVQAAAVRALAAARGLSLVEQTLPDLAALEPRFQAFAAAGVQAVLILSSPLVAPNSPRFAAQALAHRLPTITMFPEYAKAGGLMAYGPDIIAMYRPMGEMVGKALRGVRLAELPVERPSRLSLVINLTTARQLGITVPPAVLGRADEVVE